MSPKTCGTATSGAQKITLPLLGHWLPQSPLRSGLPSEAFGAGAARFGVPLVFVGTPAVGYFNHCADAGAENSATMTRVPDRYTVSPPRAVNPALTGGAGNYRVLPPGPCAGPETC